MDMHYLYKRVFQNLNLDERLKLFDNANDALNFLQESFSETEVIFSDINMPKVDGLELKRRINEDNCLRDSQIPFVFLSTSASERDIQKSTTLGVQGFFEKGVTLDEMERTINQVLSQWKA